MKRPVIAGRAVRGLTLALLPALGLLSACASTGASNGESRASIEKAPPACFDTTVAIYFERNSAEVTREAQAVLRSAAQMAKGCTVESVRVVGLADAVGAADANQALSEERARTTTAALTAVGFTAPRFDEAAAGETGAVTASGEAQPLRRRADVRIDLTPPR